MTSAAANLPNFPGDLFQPFNYTSQHLLCCLKMSLEDPKPAEYVTLVSNDGFEFVIPRSTACVSGTIRRMLDPASKFSEAITGRCVLENISGVVLEKVCEYFCYNEKNKEQANVADMDIPSELCLELLMAADYLDT